MLSLPSTNKYLVMAVKNYVEVFWSCPILLDSLTSLAQKTNIFVFGSFATDERRIYLFEKNIIFRLKQASFF